MVGFNQESQPSHPFKFYTTQCKQQLIDIVETAFRIQRHVKTDLETSISNHRQTPILRPSQSSDRTWLSILGTKYTKACGRKNKGTISEKIHFHSRWLQALIESTEAQTSWFHLFAFQWFHVLFNSLFKVLCNFPSRYLFAIGLAVIFSLGWSLPPTLSCTLKQPDSRMYRFA
ncbi:hypothetical protein DERF_001707 [Dermatophagoides farinae]|uniref:Uncharacterized protein n=1 Tax=Dermatophagoides farinae TaxID=6954 RepID=A0A922IE86_DERFA|nr:hypothetical protein DERF_001707 [Dermatophagoides farinae]